jgi:cytochrome c553
MQYFDTQSVKFDDPVAALRYAEHTEARVYPNFTLTNCESCHEPNTFNVPDQSKSLPSLHSASVGLPNKWFTLATSSFGSEIYGGSVEDRNIGGRIAVPPVPPATATTYKGVIPSYVNGPAARACGGCHRAAYINEDDVNGLASFNAHVSTNGYLVDTSKTNTTWANATQFVYGVINNIMAMF